MIVKASEIVKSEHYACHCTLRFPRFVGIHPTKQWDECMTLEEMQALRKAADGRLTGKRGADDEGGGAAKKRRQQNRPTGRRVRGRVPHGRRQPTPSTAPNLALVQGVGACRDGSSWRRTSLPPTSAPSKRRASCLPTSSFVSCPPVDRRPVQLDAQNAHMESL